METLRKESRNLGIDALRALAMFFVICLHILGQGGILAHTAPGTGKFYFLNFLHILAYCAVDVYGITTGYLLCRKRFRLARLTKLWLTTVFWSVAVSCCFFLLLPESRTLTEMVSMFLPILRGRYWFFTAYFVTMLVSPVLNVVIRTLSRRQFRLLFGALFVIFGVIPVCALGNDVLRISGGNHFAWMIVLYLIGGYLRVHGVSTHQGKKGRWLLGYFAFAALHLLWIFGVRLVGFESWSDLCKTNVSPFSVGEAVCLFLYFKEAGASFSGKSLAGKLVGWIAPGVYAVYVIHVHPLVFWSEDLIALLRPWDAWGGWKICLAMVASAALVFAVCILLDAVRRWLFRVLRVDSVADRLSDWAERKIRKALSE